MANYSFSHAACGTVVAALLSTICQTSAAICWHSMIADLRWGHDECAAEWCRLVWPRMEASVLRGVYSVRAVVGPALSNLVSAIICQVGLAVVSRRQEIRRVIADE